MLTSTLDPISNRADWTLDIEIIDDDTSETIDVSAATDVQFEMRPRSGCRDLCASLGDGRITFPEGSVIRIAFDRADLTCLSPGLYEVGLTITLDDETTQLLIGSVPVVDGIVRR